MNTITNNGPSPSLDPEPLAVEDPSGTRLISQLANEIYAEFQRRVPPSIPQTAPPSGDSATVLPVHPEHETLVDQTPKPAATSSGGAGAANSHSFGEPHCETSHRDSKNAVEPGLDHPSNFSSTPDYYFLQSNDVRAGTSQPASPALASGWDIASVRRDFPALHQHVNGRPLIWLDNAATTHKPQAVIDATSRFYARDNSNIHRAAHALAVRSTDLFEGAREKVRKFLGASSAKEIIFVRGTTEGINLVAQSFGRKNIGAGDEIILTELEHHANIVPWQLLAEQTGAVLRVVPINDRGEVILEEYAKLLGPRTKIVSVGHVSNALGTIVPIEEIIALAHARGVPVLVDGAQSTPHFPVNVTALDVDFFVFSAHKVFGPTGIGALYGKAPLLESMPPWQGGGHMIKDVRFEKTTYQNAPEKFEAGTPDIAGAVGLGAAIDYVSKIGLPAFAAYEHSLLDYATEALSEVPGLRPIGTAASKASVLSFVIPGVSTESIARHLDQHGIAVRAGHHCAQPAHRHFGLESTVRPSLAFYNTRDEVDALVRALRLLRRS
jgi:SufS family cysteine desulfurase